MSKNLFKIITTLFTLLSQKKDLINETKTYFKFLTKMLKTQGLLHTVKYFKQIRLHVTRYMCGQPLFVNDLKIGLDKSGFPKQILFMKKYFDSGDTIDIRLCLTLLMITRGFIYPSKQGEPIKIDLTTINSPYKGVRYTIPNAFIKDFINFYQFKAHVPTFDPKDIKLSTKAGPSGPSTNSILPNMCNFSYDQLHYFSRITTVDGFN